MVGSLLLVGLTASSVGDVAPKLRVIDSLSCPGPSQLQVALDRQLGEGVAAVGAGPAAPAEMELFADQGSRFRVRLMQGTPHVVSETTLDAHEGSCAALARSVALLAQTWLGDLPSRDDWTTAQGEAAVVRSEIAAVPPPVGPPAVVASVSPPESRAREARLALAASMDAVTVGGVNLGGSLFAWLSFPARWGVGLRFSLLPTLNGVDTQGGTVTVQQQAGAILVSYAFLSGGDTKVSVAAIAGPLLTHTAGQEQGFPQGSSYSSWEPGFLLGARAAQPLGHTFFVFGELDGELAPTALQFQVSEGAGPPTTLVTEPAFRLVLSLGAGVRFF